MIKNGPSNNNYSIINISSVHESIPQPQAATYAASKEGMEMLTKNIALELAAKGIRVKGIDPVVTTDMNKDKLKIKRRKRRKRKGFFASYLEARRNSKGSIVFGIGRCKLYHWGDNLCRWRAHSYIPIVAVLV